MNITNENISCFSSADVFKGMFQGQTHNSNDMQLNKFEKEKIPLEDKEREREDPLHPLESETKKRLIIKSTFLN